MAGFDRSRISLGRRTQQQTDTRESSGGVSRQGFMNYQSCGLKFFKMADVGKYHDLNILPWQITTKNHPEVVAGHSQIGDYDYVLDLMVHTRIGPGNGDFICPKKNFNKACPICERAEELWKNEETKNEARALFAKRKCVYVVEELNEKFHHISDEPKIMEISHATFSQELQSRATACLRGKGVVNFADPGDEGRVVSFSVNEGTMGNGKTFKKAGNFEFNERVEEVSDDILAKCPSLDGMMVVKTYDQLKAALYGDPEDVESDFEAQQEQAPARFNDNAPARFDDEPPTHRTAEEAPARQRNAEDAPRRRNVEQDAPRPARQSSENTYEEARRSSRRAVEDEPVEDTEDTATMPFDEPAEKPARSRGEALDSCPNGLEFGVDCDNSALCSKCPDTLWSKCQACKNKKQR